ncbi:Methyltransferase type 11 [Rhodopseudomonas palustris TIE-1]|nr:Methyltransferase type 11 [Rhodopseudomonas palustris TIE-1]
MRHAPPPAPLKLDTYSRVASEYYDAQLHPTCRNFRDASKSFLRKALAGVARGGWMVEVGAGDSLVCELGHTAFGKLVLLDKSDSMLSYSAKYRHLASLVVGDALALPFLNNSISVMVASLADPFNVPEFWSEVRRALRVGGWCIFTSPSYEWARSFRLESTDELQGAALFQLRSGERVHLPSLVWPEDAQVEMIRRAGLTVVSTNAVGIDALPTPLSPKILGCKIVVTGFVIKNTGRPA